MSSLDLLPSGDKGRSEPRLKLLLLSEVDIFRDLTAEEMKEVSGIFSFYECYGEGVSRSPCSRGLNSSCTQ